MLYIQINRVKLKNILISFAIDSRYVQDLEDDFIMNEDRDLYKFINNGVIKWNGLAIIKGYLSQRNCMIN